MSIAKVLMKYLYLRLQVSFFAFFIVIVFVLDSLDTFSQKVIIIFDA